MKGWQIFRHSVQLVFRNIDAALRVSAVLYVIYAAMQIMIMRAQAALVEQIGTLEDGSFDPAAPVAIPGPGIFVGSLLSIVIALWIAVSWHRYVLREELPHGWLPAWHGGAVLRYLVRSVVVGLCALGAAVLTLIPLGFVAGGLAAVAALAAGAYVFYRLCPALPATAVDAPMSLREAWAATSGAGDAIFTLVGLTILASLVLSIPNMVAGDPTSVISLVYSLAVGWVFMLVGASVLTTFYGHYVEGRALG